MLHNWIPFTEALSVICGTCPIRVSTVNCAGVYAFSAGEAAIPAIVPPVAKIIIRGLISCPRSRERHSIAKAASIYLFIYVFILYIFVSEKVKLGIFMETLSLIFMAIGLAMDAFAVSVCKGMTQTRMNWGNALKAGFFFGVFQALMPLIGYWAGVRFHHLIASYDHWIAFLLLAFIGGRMVVDSFKEKEQPDCSFGLKSMLVLAIATSIDALAAGITLGFLETNIITAVVLIGAVTFAMSFLGVKLGHLFGSRFSSKAELTGGIILILIGVKILLEHLSVI
jgi:putative Mn2+ efflux pump MntP